MPYTKINSRWIKDLNISCNTIKVLEENVGRKISDIPCSNILTDTFPKARDIKERINKWDLINIKSFYKGHKDKIKGDGRGGEGRWDWLGWGCLLYTSDAADETSTV